MAGLLNDSLSGSGLLANFQQQAAQQKMRRQLGWESGGGGFAQPQQPQQPMQGMPSFAALSSLSPGAASGGNSSGGGAGDGAGLATGQTGMDGGRGLGLSGPAVGLLGLGASLLGGPLAGMGISTALGLMNSNSNAQAIGSFGKGMGNVLGIPGFGLVSGLLGGGGGRGGMSIDPASYAAMMDFNDAQGGAAMSGLLGSDGFSGFGDAADAAIGSMSSGGMW